MALFSFSVNKYCHLLSSPHFLFYYVLYTQYINCLYLSKKSSLRGAVCIILKGGELATKTKSYGQHLASCRYHKYPACSMYQHKYIPFGFAIMFKLFNQQCNLCLIFFFNAPMWYLYFLREYILLEMLQWCRINFTPLGVKLKIKNVCE
jgi:hypothetical protein